MKKSDPESLMQKDGTAYLALVEYESGKTSWEIVRWGQGAMLPTTSATGWVTPSGLKVRISRIVKAVALDTAVACVEDHLWFI